MNKDVIYIEPEDDITDIITKIENAKSKIVALVPPKKAGVFRSIVNIKLITKAGTSAEKTIVLVTNDPSIKKLAAATKLPVAKNLQTAPVIPKAESDDLSNNPASIEEVDEDGEKEENNDEDESEVKDATSNTSEKSEDNSSDEENNEEDEKTATKALTNNKKNNSIAKTKKPANKIIAWIIAHKKLAILSGIGCLLLILFMIWAFAIAPSVTLTVGIKTELNNFSENVSFTTNLEEENADEGKFYLNEEKVESIQEVSFKATGSKNIGEKASGEVIVYTYFKEKGTVPISAGSNFTISGLTYISEQAVSLSWDGKDLEDCGNNNQVSMISSGCLISGRVPVTASAPGTNYNIAASNSGWNTTANVAAYSDQAMSGGTDEFIEIIQQSDIDKAKSELATTNETEDREKLMESIDKDALTINSSFNKTTSDAVSTPAVGEEVKEGVTPSIKVTVTASIYTIDKTKVEKFINKKANLGDAEKIYEMKDPFIENFSKNNNGITGKLKTSYLVGPKITENDVIEKIKGKGLGEAQHDLRDINGVSEVRIDKSVPWIMNIPNNPNKITIIFEVKDQNGNEVKQNQGEQESEEKSDKEETKKENEEEKKESK